MLKRFYILIVSVFITSASASAADFIVSGNKTLTDAISQANANTDNDMYEIEISGSTTGGGKITKSTSITGVSNAVIDGFVEFSGKDIHSEVKNVTFDAGGVSALTNGAIGSSPGQILTIDSTAFNNRTYDGNYGAGVSNIGDMTIQNNSSFENNRASDGGAVFNTGTLTVKETSFSNNTATNRGGAINNFGTLFVSDSTYSGNKGIYTGGAIHTSGAVSITNSDFLNNHAGEGGAVYVQNNVKLTISDSRFIGNNTSINSQGVSDFGGAINSFGQLIISDTLFKENYSTEGGAIKLQRNVPESTISGGEFQGNFAVVRDAGAIMHDALKLNIDGTKFTENESQNANGGAIVSNSVLNITGSASFTGNKAAKNAGAIEIKQNETTIDGASFSQNSATAGNGGAIYVWGNAALNVNNASFSQNHADNGQSGALYSSGNTTVQNVTFDGNSAIYGGGIINFGQMTIKGGSSFTNNTATAGGAIFTVNNLTLDTTDGDILFQGNFASDSDSGGADIYLNDGGDVHLIIQGDGNTLSMDGGIAGTGNIDKTGNNTLVFEESVDNTLFRGNFSQSAGITRVYADHFFGGTNTISNGSILHFARQAHVDTVSLKTGGRLDLRRDGAFFANTLNVSDLVSDGTGIVALQTNGTTADLLKITNSATGKITLDITPVGTNPTKNKIQVVDMSAASGNAEFELSTGKVDIGAHEYMLAHDPDKNWYIETDGTLTKTAQAVRGIPSLHLSIVHAGMNELRKRMGDLRDDNPNARAGGWVRGYGKHLRIHETIGAKMDLLGTEGGFDMAADLFGGKTYFGVMGGYLSSNNMRVRQAGLPDAKGHTQTPTVGVYTTWISPDTGWFADLTARHFWVRTDLNNIFGSAGVNGYDIKRRFWAFSAEAGKRFIMSAPNFKSDKTSRPTFAIEPKAELRYAYGHSKNFKTDNGDDGFIDSTHSFLTRFNVQTSYLPDGIQSKWKPFLDIGVFNEWNGKTKTNFANTDLTTSDIGGFGFEASLGINADLSDNAYWYGALTLETGKASTSYLFNIGMRLDF